MPRHRLALILCLLLSLCACAGSAPAPTPTARERGQVSMERTGLGPIVLDPGHGGEDTGATIDGVARESAIVLAVALKAREALGEKAPQLDVRLTRESDTFVPLQGRMALANEIGAELFVSVHVNSAARLGARGVETYLLSAEATDDEAHKVALAENAVLRQEGRDPTDPLFLTLLSLASAEQLKQSEELAGIVHTRLSKTLPTENRGVKQAPFFVLSRAQMPSVLVEIGFITNPDERIRLQDADYQRQIADGLADAVIEYLKLTGRLPQRMEEGK